jgi:hypothetical protein
MNSPQNSQFRETAVELKPAIAFLGSLFDQFGFIIVNKKTVL